MAKIIAIVNHKGGVGKTTTTVNLGAALARSGANVLCVDIDSQQNLTSSLMNEEEVSVSISDSLSNGVPLPIVKVSERLHLCPSDLNLADIEADRKFMDNRKRDKLKSMLAPLATKYDYILIDCPPSFGLLTVNALVAANEIYLPLTGEALPLRGIVSLENFVMNVRRINPALSISGVIIQRFNNRRINNAVLDVIRAKYGEKLFNTKIRECIALAEAPAAHCSIYDYDPDSNGAKDYSALAKEVIKRNK